MYVREMGCAASVEVLATHANELYVRDHVMSVLGDLDIDTWRELTKADIQEACEMMHGCLGATAWSVDEAKELLEEEIRKRWGHGGRSVSTVVG